jgi:hypothetical protein
MAGTTAINAIPYPVAADAPDVVAEMAASSGIIDSRTVPRFVNASARDAAITSPVAGQFAYLTTESLMTYYQSAAWRPLANVVAVVKPVAESTSLVFPTYQDDDSIKFYAEANSVYEYELFLGISNSVGSTGAIIWRWTVPAGTTGTRGSIGPTRLSNNSVLHNVNFTSQGLAIDISMGGGAATSNVTFAQENGIVRTSSTPGIVQLQWCKNTVTAGTTTLSSPSTSLHVRKIR